MHCDQTIDDKKGNKLLLDHGFSGGDRFSNSDSVLSNFTADCMVGWLVGFVDAVYVGKFT